MALLRRATTALRTRVQDPDGDRGAALLTVISLMFVVGALSALLLGSVLSQVRPSAFAKTSSRTVFAAEAGLQAGLSEMRTVTTTVDGLVVGDRTKLPCSLAAPVGDAVAQLSYSVTITYLDADPTGQPASWAAGHTIACGAAGAATTPAYALLTSQGLQKGTAGPANAQGDRAITSVYTFRLTTENIPGGLMYTGASNYCLRADSATAGAAVHYVAASLCTPTDPLEKWIYNKDYEFRLASTDVPDPGQQTLCLTGPDSGVGAVVLQPCVGGDARWKQLFSYEGGAHFRGQTSWNDYGSACLWSGQYADAAVAGRALVLGAPGCSGTDSDYSGWAPEPRVGAGAAGRSTNQVVNYLEFGRCMDVTNETFDVQFEIVYPCKADPSGLNRFNWNHKWYYTEADPSGSAPVSTTISVTTSWSETRCLTAPSAAASPAFVTFVACNGSPQQQFTRTTDSSTAAYRYTFRDSLGRCLAAQRFGGYAWSKIVAVPCTGGAEQKWNAPASEIDASLTGTRELLG